MPLVEPSEAAIVGDVLNPTFGASNVEDLGIAGHVIDNGVALKVSPDTTKRQMLRICEIEIAQEQHLVAKKQRPQHSRCVGLNRVSNAKPGNFCAQDRSARNDRQAERLVQILGLIR